MGGRCGVRTSATRARNGGRGVRVCQASGFIRPAHEVVHDVRQGLVAPEFADLTPGFGTAHPQDRRAPTAKTDPKPIRNPSMDPNPGALSAADLGYDDAAVRESIRLGVPVTKLEPGLRPRPTKWGEDPANWGEDPAQWGFY